MVEASEIGESGFDSASDVGLGSGVVSTVVTMVVEIRSVTVLPAGMEGLFVVDSETVGGDCTGELMPDGVSTVVVRTVVGVVDCSEEPGDAGIGEVLVAVGMAEI